jgi:hypothetical protein
MWLVLLAVEMWDNISTGIYNYVQFFKALEEHSDVYLKHVHNRVNTCTHNVTYRAAVFSSSARANVIYIWTMHQRCEKLMQLYFPVDIFIVSHSYRQKKGPTVLENWSSTLKYIIVFNILAYRENCPYSNAHLCLTRVQCNSMSGPRQLTTVAMPCISVIQLIRNQTWSSLAIWYLVILVSRFYRLANST